MENTENKQKILTKKTTITESTGILIHKTIKEMQNDLFDSFQLAIASVPREGCINNLNYSFYVNINHFPSSNETIVTLNLLYDENPKEWCKDLK